MYAVFRLSYQFYCHFGGQITHYGVNEGPLGSLFANL